MNIVSVVENYGIELTKIGEILRGYCPFHDDKGTPNFTVYPKTNSWYCYACCVGGSAIDFVAKIEKISKIEARKRLGRIYGFKKEVKFRKGIPFKKEMNLLVSKECFNYFSQHPNEIPRVFEVLKKFDQYLLSKEEIFYEEGLQIVENFKQFLYNNNEGNFQKLFGGSK